MRTRWAFIVLASAACSGGGGGSDCTMNLTVTNGGTWFSSGTLTSDTGPNQCATVAAYVEPGKFLYFKKGDEEIQLICGHDDDTIGDKAIIPMASFTSGPANGDCDGTIVGTSAAGDYGHFVAHGTLHLDKNDHVVGGRIAGSFSDVTITLGVCSHGSCDAATAATFSGSFDVPITDSDRP